MYQRFINKLSILLLNLPFFINADEFNRLIKAYGIVWLQGGPGDGKTLLAVVLAYHLLRSKRYRRVYSNIPVEFADTPLEITRDINGNIVMDSDGNYITKEIGNKFDFSAPYARDTIFLFDEGWVNNSTRKKKATIENEDDELAVIDWEEVVSLVRHRRQVFIIASTTIVNGAQRWCHVFCGLSAMGIYIQPSALGIPVKFWSFDENPLQKGRVKKGLGWFATIFPSRAYPFYPTEFDATSIVPIAQKDVGAIYDTLSRRIPAHLQRHFIINSKGLAERRKNLSEDVIKLLDEEFPEFFDVNNAIQRSRKIYDRKNPFSIVGNDFSLAVMVRFMLHIYFSLVLLAMIIHLPDVADLMSAYHREHGIHLNAMSIIFNNYKNILLMENFDLEYILNEQK